MFKKDMVKVGDKYGELTIIAEDYHKERLEKEKHPERNVGKYFLCKCSCGKETSVQIYQLTSGKTKSCGHLSFSTEKGGNIIDMVGRQINSLTVLRLDNSKPSGAGKHAYWICKCQKCGKEVSIRSSELRNGREDCGCEHFKRTNNGRIKNLLNKTFGHLHVIDRDWNERRNGRHAYWICKCDLCGNTESVSSDMLIQYGKDRCKICMGVSLGERKIYDFLTENNISFVYDKSYQNLKFPDTGGSPRFDFRITQNTDCDYIIEFDGEQHFKSVPLYNSAQSFEERQNRDNFKNEWCKSHNIPIIRIPYTRLNKICIEDLLPETSMFLVA